jgi:hypothetical protein
VDEKWIPDLMRIKKKTEIASLLKVKFKIILFFKNVRKEIKFVFFFHLTK